MRYSQDLPIEEQRRLDQMHLDMQGGTRTGLDSMFDDAGRPQPMVAAPPTISNHMVDQNLAIDGIFDPSKIVDRLNQPPQFLDKDPRHFTKPIRMNTLQSPDHSLIGQPLTSLPQPTGDILPDPVNRLTGSNIQLNQIRPEVMPRPEIFKPKGGRGGNFLNRFERLLEGLEGLIGKLGGDSKPDPSPLVDPAGGIGSISPISTPFTPSQDY